MEKININSPRELLGVFYNLHIAPKLDSYLPPPYPHIKRPRDSTKSKSYHHTCGSDHDHLISILSTWIFWHTVRIRGIVYAVTKFIPNSYMQIRIVEIYWKRKLGLSTKRRRYTKHTEEEIRRILDLRRQGYSYYRIAKELNVPVSYVYYICKGKILKWSKKH